MMELCEMLNTWITLKCNKKALLTQWTADPPLSRADQQQASLPDYFPNISAFQQGLGTTMSDISALGTAHIRTFINLGVLCLPPFYPKNNASPRITQKSMAKLIEIWIS